MTASRLSIGASGPCAIGHVNKRRSQGLKGPAAEQAPDAADMALIREFYARDFERFGYDLERPEPAAPKPALLADYIAARCRTRPHVTISPSGHRPQPARRRPPARLTGYVRGAMRRQNPTRSCHGSPPARVRPDATFGT